MEADPDTTSDGIDGQGGDAVPCHQTRPRDPLNVTADGQSKQALVLVGDPQGAARVLIDAVYDPPGNASPGDEAVVFHVAEAAQRRDPEPSPAILEEAVRVVAVELSVRPGSAGHGYLDLPIAPPVQAAVSPDPHGTLPSREE